MSQVGTRKRPAPGASPMQSPSSQNFAAVNHNGGTTTTTTLSDQYANWAQQGSASYTDPSNTYDPSPYNGLHGLPTPQSNQLAKRTMVQPMVPRNSYIDATSETWPVAQDGPTQSEEDNWANGNEEMNQMIRRAEIAKRESQGKKKGIPPFIQKLSSFLEEERNTDLIRWSDRGDSFIVVDEDEFARTLIPELFKHNNYASFVRQLNMYGFHKKVGLSDNSMRASEKKNKSPSEYINPFFQRGRPILLWLIQKPKNQAAKGSVKGGSRSRQDEANNEEDADDMYYVDAPASQTKGQESLPRNGRQPLMIGNAASAPSQDQMINIQRELELVRKNQKMISGILHGIKQENERQALAYQSLHDRHESSINAILTFLATVYNRSLGEGQGPSFGSVLAGAIPQNVQAQGNVVDVEDYSGQTAPQIQRLIKKQPLLLKAPPTSKQHPQVSSADSPQQMDFHLSPNEAYRNSNPGQSASTPVSPAVQDLLSPSDSIRSSQSPQVHPTNGSNTEQQLPEVDIMSMINTHNAANNSFSPGTRMDFPEALSHLQNADGQSPLTDNQRHDALRMIASANPTEHTNNALTLPNPPTVNPAQFNNQTAETLEFLTNAMKEQEQKVDSLSQSLAPLSPSGSIPGMNADVQFDGSDLLNYDSIFNNGDYFNTANADFNLDNAEFPDLNFDADIQEGQNGISTGSPPFFGYDGAADDDTSREIETVGSSEATSPAVTVGEETAEPQEEYGRGKRRKKS